ncbi:hypothetical protein [Metabacillus fastidiosus]|uniref:hypothetical protein n=1 Tax=Metabacillus fastidiosus TaxID=1458 RepID=UPI003D2CA83E
MGIFDIFVFFSIGLTGLVLVFAVIAKKRQDNNEPVFGWKRKQFLEEQQGGGNENIAEQTKVKSKKVKRNKDEVSLKDLIEVQDIKYGIFEKSRNEYSLAIATDFVNFDLLNASERQSIILGYQSLFRVINFPVHLVGQAVRQDLRKEKVRFKENLESVNSQTRAYNNEVIEYISKRATDDFRLTRRVYYIVSYIYEPSKMGKLTQDQKERRIAEILYQQATIVQKMLARAKIESEILDSLQAMEIVKRALNRERMILHPIEGVAEAGREKISNYITVDPETLPGFEDLVQNLAEVMEDYEEYIPEEEESQVS